MNCWKIVLNRRMRLHLILFFACLSFYASFWSEASAGVISAISEKIYGTENKIVVVLVDVSISVNKNDWDIYTATFNALLNEKDGVIKPGDRIVLGKISEQTIANYQPYADVEFPKTNIPKKDEEAAREAANKLIEKFKNLKMESRQTNIMASLNIAQDIFARDKIRKAKWILILSDMIESSKNHNFARTPVTEALTNKIIKEQKQNKTLPSLKGVKIFVAGAGGNIDDKKFIDIRSFWFGYFKETGAICDESRYGRTAIKKFE